jgi:hypothetical protein
MPLNLKGIQKFIEGEMVDKVHIVHDPEGTKDDTFNKQTGQYVPGPNDQIEQFDGPALITQLNVFPSQSQQAGGTALQTDFEIHIPLNSPPLTLYSIITVIECMRIPSLVGQEFRVRSLEANTFSVSQAARIYRFEHKVTL